MSEKSDDDSHSSDGPQENQSQTISIPISPRTKTINIPHNWVGVVIGEKGRRINTLEHLSGARIQFGNFSEGSESGFRKLHLTGSQDEIRKAEEMINFVLEAFEAGGIPDACWATSFLVTLFLRTMEVPQNKAFPSDMKPRTSGTAEEIKSARENAVQVLTEGLSRVLNDKGKQKVAEQENDSQDDMATPESFSIPNVTIDSALKTSNEDPDQHSDQSQSSPWTYAQNRPESNQAVTASVASDPRHVYMYPSDFFHKYSRTQAQTRPEDHNSEPNQAGTASQGQNSSELYRYPYDFNHQCTCPQENGSLQVYTYPNYFYNSQPYPFPYAEPRPEAHISEPNHSGTASQEHGSLQVYTYPGYFYNSQPYRFPYGQPHQPEVYISEPNHAGTASQEHGSLQVYRYPNSFYYSQPYQVPDAQPQPEAHISEPNQSGTASQGHDSSEVAQTTSHPSSKTV